MRSWTALLLAFLFAGCVSSNVVVRMPPPGAPEGPTRQTLAEVQVKDLRQPGTAASTREAAFGVPMGNISFDPPEAQLIRRTLEYELTKQLGEKGVVEKRTYSCDLLEFGVNTVTTPVYWDVVGRIKLVLKRDGKEYPLSGANTERTYIWPGESIIRKVVEESLKQVAEGVKAVPAD
jgi:hypothetical protein